MTKIRHEKEHKPKLLSPDIFCWGRGLPREGVGAKKSDKSLEAREIKLFWRDTPGFCRDIPEVPEEFEDKKSLCSILGPYKSGPEDFAQKVGQNNTKGLWMPSARAQ